MNKKRRILSVLLLIVLMPVFNLFADPVDQTDTYSRVYSPQPRSYKLLIKPCNTQGMSLPKLQAFSAATYKNNWIILGGIHGGQHDFGKANKTVYVINPYARRVWHKKITAKNSTLTREMLNALESTNTEFYQKKNWLYVIGGYGQNIDSKYVTFNKLSAVNVAKLIQWVKEPSSVKLKSDTILQISGLPEDNIDNTGFFQVTGGEILPIADDRMALIFGNDYSGPYNPTPTDPAQQVYTKQVRTFAIFNTGTNLSYQSHYVSVPDPNFRRRDMNIFPSLLRKNGVLKSRITALSGVFTLEKGVWTVPVVIGPLGKPKMLSLNGFRQAMNQYNSAKFGMYSKKNNTFTEVLLGGITRNIFDPSYPGNIKECDSLPYTNQITAYVLKGNDESKQYYLGHYPSIEKQGVQEKFGADAEFFMNENVPHFNSGIIKYDKLKAYQVIGFIYGGIISTGGSQPVAASNKIFQVMLKKR